MISQEIIGPTASPTWRDHTYATTQPCGRSHGNRAFRGYPSLFGFSEQNRDKTYNQIFLSVSLFLSLSCVQAVLVLYGITYLLVCMCVYIYIYICNVFTQQYISKLRTELLYMVREIPVRLYSNRNWCQPMGVSQMHYTLQMHYIMYFS